MTFDAFGPESVITMETRGRVCLIGLNRPEKRNAFSLEMLESLAMAYTAYEDDDDLWAAVLFAHGDDFTAGLDLSEVGPRVQSGAPLFPKGSVDPLGLYGKARKKPVVCAVQGWCLTIGIELLLACDMTVAASNVRMRQMEVNRGIMPFGGATLRMPKVVGWGNAMRYLLTGDEISAVEAHRIGLVQEVVEPGEHLEAAIRLADRIASCAPLAVRATRWSSDEALHRGFETARDELMVEARALMKSEDALEGMRSFIERRDADFKGR